MYRVALICVLLLLASSAEAREVVLVEQESSFDLGVIEDIEIEKTLVGTLNDFPHTFEMVVTTPTDFSVDILAPSSNENPNFSGILTVEVERGVREVARLPGSEASWETVSDQIAGLQFQTGPSLDLSLEPGFYWFEVSTPTNEGTYVLKIGDVDNGRGYFSALSDVYDLRRALGYSRVSMLASPLIYGPLLVLLFGGYVVYRRRKRND